jgi:hypothetical protein
VFLFAGGSLLGQLLALLGRFVLAVGAGLVLMHVVTRAIGPSRER